MKRVIVALCFHPVLAAAAGASGGAVGQPAPVCELQPLGGSPPVDMRQFRGKVLYVDFWASWCSPCKKSFPFMNALDDEFRDRGLQVLGINVDEDAGSARAFLSRYPASFVLGADSSGRCPRAFDVQAMPSSYLVDRKGIIRYVHLGFRPGQAEQLRRVVEQLLADESDGR
jgi:peroxiredoxin